MSGAARSPGVYCALLHHPVQNRQGESITTALTNLDVHDLSRSARTWELAGVFVVTPVDAQRQLVDAILAHWDTGAGASRVPERSEALRLCASAGSLNDVSARIEQREGTAPLRIATGARPRSGAVLASYEQAREMLAQRTQPVVLLFGTGHGLASEVLEGADAVLPPIRAGGYNHLSVRAAQAVVLDRLFGEG